MEDAAREVRLLRLGLTLSEIQDLPGLYLDRLIAVDNVLQTPPEVE